MRLKQIAERGRPLVLALGFSLVLLTAGISAADRETLPGEVLLLSDEIFGNSAEITRPSGPSGSGSPPAGGGGDSDSGDSDSGDSDSGDGVVSGGGGNDKNKSGLDDGSNPGQGSGTANSPNEGTDNPNNSGN